METVTKDNTQDAVGENSTTGTPLSEGEMKDKVYEISQMTNDDGTLDVTIKGIYIDEDNNEATVRFDTFTRGIKTETMRLPKTDSPEYKLVRIARKTIGDFSNINQAEGLTIPADPDTWEIDASLSPAEQSVSQNLQSIYNSYQLYNNFSLFLFVGSFYGSIAIMASPFILGLASLFTGVSFPGLNQTFIHLLVGMALFLLSGTAFLQMQKGVEKAEKRIKRTHRNW